MIAATLRFGRRGAELGGQLRVSADHYELCPGES
jgi:hypothetical protein